MRFSWTTTALLIACVMTIRADESERAKYIGSASCATFGCHGNTVTRTGEMWKSAFIVWTKSDPHAGAFEVLFNERSAKMVELLLPNLSHKREGEAPAEPQTAKNAGSAGASPSQNPTAGNLGSAGASPSQNISNAKYEASYWSVIEKRCVSCHATPAAHDTIASSATPVAQAESLRHGVSCESCHGMAGKWLTEHATLRWSNYSPAVKTDSWGLTNTQDLAVRAAVCVECHVGPRESPTGEVFDVTHDLIAAGHPRLSFEFSAYFANLPPHWDEAKDRTQHGGASFHFDGWRIGQYQTARKLARQLELRSSPNGHSASHVEGPEFANYDCFACHHRLRTNRSSTTRGQPQPVDWPFAQLQIIARSSSRVSLRELDQPLANARKKLALSDGESRASRQQTFADLRNALDASSQSMLHDRLSREGCVTLLENLLADTTARREISWDRVAQFQLALAAFVEDCEPGETKRTAIARHTQQLASYLNGRFGMSRPPSIYDSPERFDSADNELSARLLAISAELKSMR